MSLAPALFLPVLFVAACAYAAQPSLHQAQAPPALHPLPMSIGGRMLTAPAASAGSFGGVDYTYQWPGTYFRAAFEGTQVFFRVVRGDEILHIVADGHPVGSLANPEAGVYEVEGLSPGRHQIVVSVATESQDGPKIFGGFAIPDGEKVLTPAQRRRQIEFIGDSHTVGYGDLSATHDCSQDQVWRDTDDTKAFGARIAAHYGADYEVNAISGRGIVRNYDGFQADTLPQVYPWVLFDKQQKASDPAWKPQVIVLSLGTNDFSRPLHAGERWKTRAELEANYESTYLQFFQDLRARDPHALLILWATDMAQGEIEAEVRKVVQRMKQRGDQRITFLPINGLKFGACEWHPSLGDERVIADKLIHVIDAHARVWQSQ